MTRQIYGAVEFRLGGDWYEVIQISTLLLKHADLNGCLFGVDNDAGFVPLFADRGWPFDCSDDLNARSDGLVSADARPSWVLWSELSRVDWTDRASGPDGRIHEYRVDDLGREHLETKWLERNGLDAVRAALDDEPTAEIAVGDRVFRRPVLQRSDALRGTDFPLLMKLMGVLGERFGDEAVRMVVWFE